MKKPKIFCALALVLAAVLLGGCVLEPAESLYAVPKQPESYYNLQSAVEAVMGGASYSPPTAGENQQAVQLNDLDGDGSDEAILFWKTEGETPLVMTVLDKQDGQFAPVAQVQGAGNAFDRVYYVELDDRPGKEIVLGRQVAEGVAQVLNAYALRDGELTELFSASYSDFTIASLSRDGARGVFLIYQDADAANATAEFYLWSDGQAVRQREAELSAPASAVKRIVAGNMCEGVAAVFVASAYGEDSLVTDVFGFRDDTFVNFAYGDETDTGVKTVRDYYVYGCDIDGDGLLELPRLTQMPQTDDPTSADRSLICWYNLLPNGRTRDKLLTYHDYAAGWYSTVPEAWEGKLAAQTLTVDGVKCTMFVYLDGGTDALFSVAAVSSSSSAEKLKENGWLTCLQKGDTLVLARTEKNAARYKLTEETLREMLRAIPVDWNTGEID